MIETLELPKTVETLSLTRSSSIDYSGIKIEGGGYGKLLNLTIDNCSKLMRDPDFVLGWVFSYKEEDRSKLSLNLQGINWKFTMENYMNLFLLENVGTSTIAKREIRGTIEIPFSLDADTIIRLKNIFGNECFNEGSTVYIKTQKNLLINKPNTLWEGETFKYDVITVGTKLGGAFTVTGLIVEEIGEDETININIGTVDGDIVYSEDAEGVVINIANLSNGYVTVKVDETNRKYKSFILQVKYEEKNDNGAILTDIVTANNSVNKRIYPTSIDSILTDNDSYNNTVPNKLSIHYSPDKINDINLEGRGYFEVNWRMVSGSTNYDKSLKLIDSNKEIAYIQSTTGFDGKVTVEVTVTKKFDGTLLGKSSKELEFIDPNTIITEKSNGPLYEILRENGIIKEDGTGFGKLTISEASAVEMSRFLKDDGTSIFAGNDKLKSFLELQYFTNDNMGQMPMGIPGEVLTPKGMFEGCKNLTEIAFSRKFYYTSNNMFKGCNNLKYIYGPQTTDTDESGNPVYDVLPFLSVGDYFAYGCSKLETCELSSLTAYIGAESFAGCSALKSFRLPTVSDTEIKYDNKTTPFQGCINITFKGAKYGDISMPNIMSMMTLAMKLMVIRLS
jgi:hypothetical protein